MSNSLKPLSEPFSEEITEALAPYPRIKGDYLLTLFKTFANSLRFLRKGVPDLLDEDSPLSLRIRELVVLRVCANTNCEYEWGLHITGFAERIGLTPEQVAGTHSKDINHALWPSDEAYLLQAIDDLCANGSVSDATLEHFEADWTLEQQLEIFAVCGAYHTVSFVANSARLPNEPFGAKFPQA